MSQPPDPDDTAPFTSPSGPSAPGPAYGPPTPSVPPVPYGAPGQPPWVPAYGAPLPGSLDHKGATTSLVLGIIGLVSLLLTPFCCITLPGLLCAPFAWGIGAKARHEIDADPSAYGNRGSAQAGFVTGIVGTVLGLLMIVAVVAIAVAIGVTDYSLV